MDNFNGRRLIFIRITRYLMYLYRLEGLARRTSYVPFMSIGRDT